MFIKAHLLILSKKQAILVKLKLDKPREQVALDLGF